jgi:hypothetical protein
MLYAIRIAAILKAETVVMDSEFAVIDDGNYPDKAADNIQTVRFLNTVETLKTGFENDKYLIKLIPVRFNNAELFYPLIDEDTQKRYLKKSKPITETIKKFSKKLGVEVRDFSELSELQKFLMKEVK